MTSAAVRARYSVTCRRCKALPGDPCRTLTTGRVTDTHMTRVFHQHEYEFRVQVAAREADRKARAGKSEEVA